MRDELPATWDPAIQHALGLKAHALIRLNSGGRAHQLSVEVAADWNALVDAATRAGFVPIIVSGYRDFTRQACIWAGKASGQRVVVDDADQPIDLAPLTDWQKIERIMRFSALPGSSRHHWGTDFDIADVSCVADDYQIQLTETEACTVMASFYAWLDSYLAARDCPFFRPYAVDCGGVAVEPWHLSHRASAARFAALRSKPVLAQFYQAWLHRDEATLSMLSMPEELPLLPAVVENFDIIYDRFIAVTAE